MMTTQLSYWDEQRCLSMADEGGMSGALMERHELRPEDDDCDPSRICQDYRNLRKTSRIHSVMFGLTGVLVGFLIVKNYIKPARAQLV